MDIAEEVDIDASETRRGENTESMEETLVAEWEAIDPELRIQDTKLAGDDDIVFAEIELEGQSGDLTNPPKRWVPTDREEEWERP